MPNEVAPLEHQGAFVAAADGVQGRMAAAGVRGHRQGPIAGQGERQRLGMLSVPAKGAPQEQPGVWPGTPALEKAPRDPWQPARGQGEWEVGRRELPARRHVPAVPIGPRQEQLA
jgi:hypothetical protein